MNGPLGREAECFEAGLALALARFSAGGGLRCHVVSSLVQKESLAPLRALHGAGRSAAWMHMQAAPDDTGAQAAYAGVRGASIARRYTCNGLWDVIRSRRAQASIHADDEAREEAADDDQREWPLRIGADAVRERSGQKPNAATSAVIMIGRSRNTAATRVASRISAPPLRSSFAYEM